MKNQKVLFTITNLSKKNKSLYRQGMTPLVSSTSRPKWERLPEKQVYYYKKTAKYANMSSAASHLLSFVFVFDKEEDEYLFSYSFPYSYTDLQVSLFFHTYWKLIQNLSVQKEIFIFHRIKEFTLFWERTIVQDCPE